MSPELILDVAHHFDRLLSRHGYISSRAPEVLLMQPCSSPRAVGDHARFMLQEIPNMIRAGQPERAQRWLSFAEGVLWTLGVSTILEIIESHRAED